MTFPHFLFYELCIHIIFFLVVWRDYLDMRNTSFLSVINLQILSPAYKLSQFFVNFVIFPLGKILFIGRQTYQSSSMYFWVSHPIYNLSLTLKLYKHFPKLFIVFIILLLALGCLIDLECTLNKLWGRNPTLFFQIGI